MQHVHVPTRRSVLILAKPGSNATFLMAFYFRLLIMTFSYKSGLKDMVLPFLPHIATTVCTLEHLSYALAIFTCAAW